MAWARRNMSSQSHVCRWENHGQVVSSQCWCTCTRGFRSWECGFLNRIVLLLFWFKFQVTESTVIVNDFVDRVLRSCRCVHSFAVQTVEKMENGKDVEVVRTSTPLHAVIVPLPSQGHIIPCLQLAKKLVAVGFRITFVNTIHNHEQMIKSHPGAAEVEKGIQFVTVSDGLPDDHPRLGKFREFLGATLAMGPVLEKLLLDLLRKAPITCVIRDFRFSAVQEIARKLRIPVGVFVTPSAISMQCVFKIPAFGSKGILPLPPPPAHVTPSLHPVAMTLGAPRSEEEAAARQTPVRSMVPGASPTLLVEHIPTYLLTDDLDSFWVRLYQIQTPLLAECECVLFNSFSALEGDVLDAMAGDLNSNVFAVGPLILSQPNGMEDATVVMAGAGGALREEDPAALLWLDGQKPNSVLFVSFGSMATVSVEQMREFAHGLEMSGHAFLWVVRSDTITGDASEEFETMFSEFVTRTRDRALLVPWAPQTAVLSHPSVVAFLTHCGWNSTIESVASGVPMLGWPRFADQTTNCHYITQVWKIGLQLQPDDGATIVTKEEVDRKVKKMMAMEGMHVEVDEIRINSRNLEIAARKSVARGGSSHAALAKFVDLAQRWSLTNQDHPAPQSSSDSVHQGETE